MKNYFLLSILLFASVYVIAQGVTGPTGPPGATGLMGPTGITGSLPDCYTCKEELKCIQWLLIFLPSILSFSLLIYVFIRLKKEGFKIGDSLRENEPVILPNANFKSNEAPSPTNPESTAEYPKSSSRLIALLSGITAVCIATSTCSYFFYMVLRTGHNPDLSSLFNVVLTLGIGVTPYVFNKISTALN